MDPGRAPPQVADIDALFTTLQAGGVRCRAEPPVAHHTRQSELWLAGFTDPDGNQLAPMSEVALG